MALRIPRHLIFLAVGVMLASCGGSDSGPTGPATASISLAPATVAFGAVQGGAAPAAQTVAVTNGGTGSLEGLSVGAITYSAGASGWLGASLSSASGPATLTLAAKPAGLASGSYTASVPLSSSRATNSPQKISVSLLVLPDNKATSLAAGQSAVFLGSPAFSTQLAVPAGSRYLVAVVNTDPSSSATADFTLQGALTGGSAGTTTRVTALARGAAPAPSAAAPRGAAPGYAMSAGDARAIAYLRRLAPAHDAMLARNRQIYARWGGARGARRAAEARSARLSPVAASIAQTVGTVNKVYVAKSLSEGCADVDSIGARTVAVGQHVIVLADTNRTTWPDTERPDSAFYQTFADEYDQITWPHLLTYIGDPLADDGNLSGVGKVTVTLTPVLNNLGGGVLAFVSSCDFFPTEVSAQDTNFSNFTEMFYSLVPASNGLSVTTWEKALRSTAAHESKHIVSFADRIINNSPVLEEIWLEEGLAQISSEIWMRNFNQAKWKAHANFDQTVVCELNFGIGAPCNSQNTNPLTLMIAHLPFTFEYLNTESTKHTEGLGVDTPSNYGAGWAFARWVIDQYAGDEPTLIKGLINEPSLSGLPNLSSHTGQPAPLLLMYWNLASAIFEKPAFTAADPRVTIPSFDFANIYETGQTGVTCNGQPCGLFTQSGTPTFPVQPIAISPGAISQQVTGVPGTSAAYFLLSATADGTEALQLASGAGDAISPQSAFRVGILRVE
ncbi:MAG TPA: hypothetical protein VFW66_02000 [Gemmatimonadales bacterium]|nr:hypothetical protein [Gemmatimonadales bacterium]